jgi:hypothetical protein
MWKTLVIYRLLHQPVRGVVFPSPPSHLEKKTQHSMESSKMGSWMNPTGRSPVGVQRVCNDLTGVVGSHSSLWSSREAKSQQQWQTIANGQAGDAEYGCAVSTRGVGVGSAV